MRTLRHREVKQFCQDFTHNKCLNHYRNLGSLAAALTIITTKLHSHSVKQKLSSAVNVLSLDELICASVFNCHLDISSTISRASYLHFKLQSV